MSSETVDRENPFPLKAVTVFGVGSGRVAQFEYMTKARRHVVDYLAHQVGSALALSGGHGSGKTFLLNWLGNEATALHHSSAQVIYAKADNQSLTDVYRQLLRSLTRKELIEVTRKAVRNIGQNLAGAAQATRQASLEIASAKTLQPAFEAKILDPNELYLQLKNQLKNTGVSPAVSEKIGYAVGALEHTQFGEAAFVWLAGGNPQLPKDMNLPASLWTDESTDAADIATTALECMAGLYRIAEIPLIVILDQMENFIPAGHAASTQPSLIKKLIEQLSGQSALLLMAGTPAAWDNLPRDVGPRLLNRGPLVIGGLNTEETSLLLRSYYNQEPGFTNEAAATIRNLSGGGNAREILQIAHRVLAKTNGAVSVVDADLLVQAAEESGSIADRATLALQMIDTAADRLKLSAGPASTSDGQRIDRLVEGPQGASLAIVLLISPDARAEAEDARKLTSLRKQLASAPNEPGLLVVTVGYSSPRVRALVGEISRVLEFEENAFQQLVETELIPLAASVSRKVEKDRTDLSPLLEHLTKLDERLARIEANRVQSEQETADRLTRGAEELAESERAETEARTRHELRFGLDELHEALTEGDQTHERRILRKLLVANEANVKEPVFDYIGTIYLDALDSAQLAGSSEPNFELIRRFLSLRSDLIRAMRTALSTPRKHGSDFLVSPGFLGTFIVSTMSAAIAALFVWFGPPRHWIDTYAELTQVAVLAGLLTWVTVGLMAFAVFDFFTKPQRRYFKFVLDLERLRREARNNPVLYKSQ